MKLCCRCVFQPFRSARCFYGARRIDDGLGREFYTSELSVRDAFHNFILAQLSGFQADKYRFPKFTGTSEICGNIRIPASKRNFSSQQLTNSGDQDVPQVQVFIPDKVSSLIVEDISLECDVVNASPADFVDLEPETFGFLT